MWPSARTYGVRTTAGFAALTGASLSGAARGQSLGPRRLVDPGSDRGPLPGAEVHLPSLLQLLCGTELARYQVKNAFRIPHPAYTLNLMGFFY